MDSRLIKMFKASVVAKNEYDNVDPVELNALAIKAGYIIHPDVCNVYTEEFVEGLNSNYNSTFYKCWDDVERASETSILVDKLLHYATTYGTDHQAPKDLIYIPNSNPIEIPYSDYKIINKIEPDELFDKCLKMVVTSVALNPETVNVLCTYIAKYVKENNIELDINVIQNKEAQAELCNELDIYPDDKFALLRCIVYRSTHKCLLIKDKETINWISCRPYNLNVLNDEQLIKLSEIFYRFKPLFLAMRSLDVNKPIINKIRRYAKQYHKPFKPGFWETVLSQKNYKVTKEVAERVHELNNFKLVQLIQATRERLIASNIQAPLLYKIRNGKVYLKEKEYPILSNEAYYWETILEIFVTQLISNLRKKACSVKFPTNITLTCPSSEKSFLGNIPFGSYFDMNDKNYVGIYWRNEWGTRDFDLSAIDCHGNKIGWNSKYKNEGLMYSGDMTNADPEAAEILQCKKDCENSIIYVNRYCGNDGSKFELIYGSEDKEFSYCGRNENSMVNPDDIMLREMITSDSREKMVGAIINNKMYLMDFRLGDARVSINNYNNELIESIKRKTYCYMDLKNILLAAGFKERKRSTKDNPIELDLTELNKDTLIELFS